MTRLLAAVLLALAACSDPPMHVDDTAATPATASYVGQRGGHIGTSSGTSTPRAAFAATTADGADTITEDCTACHEVLAMDEPSPTILKTLGLWDKIEALKER